MRRPVRVGIEAGRLGHGGAAILDALVDTLLRRSDVDCVKVFGKIAARPDLVVVPTPTGRLNTLRWAIHDWAIAAQAFDHVVSFSGFAAAAGQTVFVHNALYYDPIADTLPLPLRLRLQVLRELTHDAVGQAKHVVVQSNLMQENVRRAHGGEAHKIITTPPPDPQTSGPKTDLLWVGNEVAFKDFRTAIEAATLLRRQLTLIGNPVSMPDGPYHSWVGDLERSEVFGHYRHANALVMTSKAESLGLPLIEAMQVGLPVIAPDLPYAREICTEAAQYFQPGNAEDLAKAINVAESRRETLKLLGTTRTSRLAGKMPFERWVDLILDK